MAWGVVGIVPTTPLVSPSMGLIEKYNPTNGLDTDFIEDASPTCSALDAIFLHFRPNTSYYVNFDVYM